MKFSAGAIPGGFKISGSPTPRVEDLKEVEWFRCHKKRHYANKCHESRAKETTLKFWKIDNSGPKSESEVKSVRQIRVRYSEIEDKRPDPFMRHWIILYNLEEIGIGSDNEGLLARICIDTGANCNTMSWKFYRTLLDEGLKCAFYPDPPGGINRY